MAELAERLEAPEVEGIQRRGIILAFLTRFKQICNHPSQWLGDGNYAPADSGKFNRLRGVVRGNGFAPGEGAGLYPIPRND